MLWVWSLAVVVAVPGAAQDIVGNGFAACKARIDSIVLDGKEWNGITNETMDQYRYFGPVKGMNPDFDRSKFITLTTEGCKIVCQDPIDWYWQTNIDLTFGIIANWILPVLALLAALPYDSLHKPPANAPLSESRVVKTLGFLNNWLGSPQTALTATFFNIHQMRKCLGETEPKGSGISARADLETTKRDAYYVLSCLGQFRLPSQDNFDFLNVLAYGLYRPFVSRDRMEPAEGCEQAKRYAEQLLHEMAFHLRMLRRRGVYPAFLNILMFCIAYAVSVVVAFATEGNRTTAHAMAFGILLSWLPLLVLFAIIDRNPVSADRCRKLFARWLFNVKAVRDWEEQFPAGAQQYLASAPGTRPAAPVWWTQRLDSETPFDQKFDRFIEGFVGQGRQTGYNGLAYAMLNEVYEGHDIHRRMRSTNTIADKTRDALRGRGPSSWYWLALVSLAIVWLEIGMATMISYNTPTVGLACRSGSYLLYGIFSIFPWALQWLPTFRPAVQKWRRRLSHVLCFIANLILFVIFFAAFSGVYNNCICKGGVSGYMDFEDTEFYRDKNHFDVSLWWTASAVLGALPMIGSLWCIMFSPGRLLSKLKPLWRASEHEDPPRDMSADTTWLI